MPSAFTGSGDHLVSEAFYFTDPEGNGIELYYDRDPALWQWKNGQVQMATIYIDPREYLDKYLVVEEIETQAKVGHVHLKVGDVAKAKQFYVEVLGFEVTAQLPHALFISVGGYHHHLGLNSWESYGASERKNSLGLKLFRIYLEELSDVERLKERLAHHTIPFSQEQNSIIFDDPWKNQILVSFLRK